MKRVLSFILAFVLVAGMGTSAYAATSIKNTIKDSITSVETTNSKGPSASDIKAVGDDDVIQMPKNSSYLENYEYMYINAPEEGLSVYAYKIPTVNKGDSNNMPFAYHGSSVTVLAVEGDFACILYCSDKNELHTAWVSKDNLTSVYPGESYSVGKFYSEYTKKPYSIVMPKVKWSNFNFVGTESKYTELVGADVRPPCFSITVEYQVISRNGIREAYGEREVYLNDGDGWVSVGTFDVNKNFDPVRFTVNFNKPVEIKAVAVIPTDLSKQGFIYRQCVVDMYCVEE